MSDENDEIGQNEIEDLLRQAQAGQGSTPTDLAEPESAETPQETPQSTPQSTPAAQASAAASAGPNDIDLLLQQAEQAIASIDSPNAAQDDTVPFTFRNLKGTPANGEQTTLELIQDVNLDVRIELGRSKMQLDEVLQLKQGSVVSLDRLAGDPVDVFVNGRLIARGEVLVLNDNFCIRIGELVAGNKTA